MTVRRILAMILPICWLVACAPAPEPVADLQVDETIQVGNIPVGGDNFSIVVRNRGKLAGRVVGVSEGCYPQGCIRAGRNASKVVPPEDEGAFVVELFVRDPGPFEIPIEMHLDVGRLKTVTVKLVGVGTSP